MAKKPGPRPKHGIPLREALPAQIAARVPDDVFLQYAGLRGALNVSNAELIDMGAKALVAALTPDQRKRYAFYLSEAKAKTKAARKK